MLSLKAISENNTGKENTLTIFNISVSSRETSSVITDTIVIMFTSLLIYSSVNMRRFVYFDVVYSLYTGISLNEQKSQATTRTDKMNKGNRCQPGTPPACLSTMLDTLLI